MNFLKKKKARAQRARTKKKGSFSAETRFFLLGNTKDLAAEGCSMSVSLLSIFIDSCVFLLELGRQTVENMAQGLENMAQKASHRQSQTAICSHRQSQAKKNHKIRLADGPWLSRCSPQANTLVTTCGPRGWARGGCCSSWGPLPFNFAYSWALADKIQALSKPT